MLRILYLYRNFTRNILRTLLTCAAVAFPIIIYVLSTAVISGFDRFLENSARQLRLAVIQKSSIVNPLPSGHMAKIRSLDPTRTRILSICGLTWIGGQVDNDPRLIQAMAAEVDTFLITFSDYRFTQQETDAWYRDRQAIVVGSATASHFGWKVGDRVTIRPSVPPYTPMEFHVVSTAELASDPVSSFVRMDYYEEELKAYGASGGRISFIFVKCATKTDLDHYRVAIDELFARTPDETKTQDEKSFMNEFVTQQFNLPRNLTILAAATIFVAVMAASNTMSMNLRDRTNEIAVLRSIGFSSLAVFVLVQIESLVLCAAGGLFGAGVPYVVFNFTPLKDYTLPVIQTLEVELAVCANALLIALCVGVVAAAWPSWAASRMTVVSALRNLE